jgi:hypothetical protein
MHRLFVLALLAGCSPLTYTWTPASAKPVSPKPDNCKVEVFTSQPTQSYEEIGYVSHYNGTPPKQAEKLRAAVVDQACAAGGDAVIAIADDKGEYTKGTVIKFTGTPAEPVKPVPDLPPPQSSDTEQPKL